MNKGKRYEEPKLNMKKVFAVVIALIVFVMCIYMIVGLLKKGNTQGEIVCNEYFSAFKDNKWGVIDSYGNTVIEPSYREMIIIPNKKRDIFLCTYDINVKDNTYKTKALNSKNEEIFTEYESIESISNIDRNNYVFYEQNVLKVSKNGKKGLIDGSGKEILKCEYDEILPIRNTEKVYKVKKDGNYGIVDEKGKIIIEPQYEEMEKISDNVKEGFVVKKKDSKRGVIDYFGKTILDLNYEEIKNIYNEKYIVIKEQGNEKLVDRDGKVVLENTGNEIIGFSKNIQDDIIIKKDGKIGVINIEGKNIIEPQYEELEETKPGAYIAKKDGKYGVIDSKNDKMLEFEYETINYYSKADILVAQDKELKDYIIDNKYEIKTEGILIDLDEEKEYFEIRQGDSNKYYNFKFEEKLAKDVDKSSTLFPIKKEGKYGFADEKDNIVIEPKYDEVTKQNAYGFSGIKKDGKWGCIDKEGMIIQEPVYNLQEYFKIDFIGRWHLGKDINVNFYNQL